MANVKRTSTGEHLEITVDMNEASLMGEALDFARNAPVFMNEDKDIIHNIKEQLWEYIDG